MIIFQAYQFYKIPQQSCLSKNVKYCPLSNWRVYTKLSLLQCIQHEHSIQQDTLCMVLRHVLWECLLIKYVYRPRAIQSYTVTIPC